MTDAVTAALFLGLFALLVYARRNYMTVVKKYPKKGYEITYKGREFPSVRITNQVIFDRYVKTMHEEIMRDLRRKGLL